ncbi:MAG: hypothetical protein PHS45_02175 [Bacilli bacterium]|nr:hypothetical protein [Bacilli bacterium]
MRKLFRLILVLAILGIIIRIGFNFLVGGHTVTYNINNNDETFNIKETFTVGYQSSYRFEKDKKNYFFEIIINDEETPTFVFKLQGTYKYYHKLIKSIYYYEDNNIRCIYPVFRIHNNQTDVLCSDGEKMLNYSNIIGENKGIDDFVTTLYNEHGYLHPSWIKADNNIEDIKGVEVFKNNLIKGHVLVLWEYDKIRMIAHDANYKRDLSGVSEYVNKLGLLVDNYYVIPDYGRLNDFNRVLVIEVNKNSQDEILLIEPISYDSYIQGVVDNKIYLFDRRDKEQYEIDPKQHTIVQVGDVDKGIKYFNGKWENISAYEAVDYKYFEIDYDIPELYNKYKYYKIDNVLGDTDGYYYLYVKNNNNTRVYRANKQKSEYVTLLFEVPKIDNVRYVDDYLYFIQDDTIYFYHDSTGVRPVLRSFELFFNKENVYYIYSK